MGKTGSAATNRTATLEFLGTGTSTGVPIAGCRCPVCHSADPRDNRLRASVLVRHGARNVVIDTGPEFRLQCVRAGLLNLAAVVYTHDHADHMNGLDDVRAYSSFKDRILPVWGDARTLAAIRHRFDYIWNAVQVGGGLPEIDLNEITGPFTAAGLEIVPVPVWHGKLSILGFRIGDLAYLTDASVVPETSFPLLTGLRTLVVSCVRSRFHKTHMALPGAKRLHRRIGPERTILTHLTHRFSHRGLLAALPVDMTPAYDGMRVEIGL